MVFNYRKISAVLTSAVMIGSSVGIAAAASFPSGFTSSPAVVYGSASPNAVDSIPAGDIADYLATQVTGGTTTIIGGEKVQLDRSNDKLNLGNALNGPFGNTVDDEDLPTLLKDGIYTADDSDDFDYEQKITLGNPVLSHFRNSDYEDLVGLDSRTPVIGINITDDDLIINYTLNFLDQAESDVVSSDLQDIEGSDLMLFGKKFYVADAKNGSNAGYFGNFILLDSGVTGIVSEGETVTLTSGGTSYDVSINFVGTNEVILTINGENTNSLSEGQTQKLADGAFIAIRDILVQDYAGGTKKVEFGLGAGKLELSHGNDVKLNDNSITNVKAFIYRGTVNGNAERIDKIDIEWKSNDDMFITPENSISMPGFGGVAFTMTELVRSDEEKVLIEADGTDSIQLSVPVKDGTAGFNILYANTTGDFVGIGKSADERLATNKTTLRYYDKRGGVSWHRYVVATYNTSDDAESYLLSFDVSQDNGINETIVKNEVTGQTWSDRRVGDTFTIGDVQFTFSDIRDGTTDDYVVLTPGSNVNFNTIFTSGGLKIYLPVNVSESAGSESSLGVINFSGSTAGRGFDTFYVNMRGEDKDDNKESGTAFGVRLDDNADNELEVDAVNSGSGTYSGTGGDAGLEIGDSKDYQTYIVDDVAPRLIHVTNPDQDRIEVHYPSGNSETYATVFMNEAGASTTTSGGNMVFMDSESGWRDMNVVVVGGTCINQAASEALGIDFGTCAGAFSTATGVGENQYLLQSVKGAFDDANKMALVVAGYSADDTVAAATRLTEQPSTVDTADGMRYIGTVSAEGTSVLVEA